MFPRAWRLTRQRDVQNVYRLGKSAGSQFLFIRCLPNRQAHARLTVVISKKIAKKAVVRNRIKRVIRQALQELLTEPKTTAKLGNVDCVVTVHRDPGLPYDLKQLKPEVSTCLIRLP